MASQAQLEPAAILNRARHSLLVGLPGAVGQSVGRMTAAAQHMSQRVRPMSKVSSSGQQIDEWIQRQIETIASGVVSDHGTCTDTLLSSLLAGPIPAELLGLKVLGPAANLLGILWAEDKASFNQVSMGMWRIRRLQDEIRDKHSLSSASMADRDKASSICLAAAPGEHHSFGLAVVAGLFEADGWFADVMPNDGGQSLLAEVSAHAIDAIGLTLSRGDVVPELSALITQLRLVSLNPQVRIVVGGSYLAVETDHAGLAQLLGADAVLGDAQTAVEQVNSLLPKHYAQTSTMLDVHGDTL